MKSLDLTIERWTANQVIGSDYSCLWNTTGDSPYATVTHILWQLDSNEVWLKIMCGNRIICELQLATLTSDFALQTPHLAEEGFPLLEYTNKRWLFRPPMPLQAAALNDVPGIAVYMKKVSGNDKTLVAGITSWGNP